MNTDILKNAKKIVKHDGRSYEIDHITSHYIFLKSLFPGKDYLGHSHYKLNKKGLCAVPIQFIIEDISSGKYSVVC